MSEAQLYWAWDRKQPYNQDGSKRYVEMVDAADYEALRDEVVRLRGALQTIATWDVRSTSQRIQTFAKDALTPQGGREGRSISMTAGQRSCGEDKNICPRTQHIDGKSHGWVFDGDDPYVVCAWCHERRDALTDRVIK